MFGRFKKRVNSVSADFHITAADGAKSLVQLMREQNPQTLPSNSVKSLEFIVDAQSNDLITLSASPVHPEFKMAIRGNTSIIFRLAKLPFDAATLLEGALARTDGTCNFFIHVEFYD